MVRGKAVLRILEVSCQSARTDVRGFEVGVADVSRPLKGFRNGLHNGQSRALLCLSRTQIERAAFAELGFAEGVESVAYRMGEGEVKPVVGGLVETQ